MAEEEEGEQGGGEVSNKSEEYNVNIIFDCLSYIGYHACLIHYSSD